MRRIREFVTFIILMILASNVAAATNKCTSANGEVIYTNTACPPGYHAKSVEEIISVVDNSAERALIAKEIEKAKAQAVSADNNGNEITVGDPATGGLTASNLARLKEAESLGQTAITARGQMGLATAIFIGIAALLLLLFRRKK